MQRLSSNPSGRRAALSASGIRTWAAALIIIGLFGRSVLEIRFLNTGDLLATLNQPGNMMAASIAIVCRLLGCCAYPLAAFLVVLAFQEGEIKKLLAGSALAAVVSEIPYDLATSGEWMNWESQNPVFGIVLSFIVLYFFLEHWEKGFKHGFLKAMVMICGMLWAYMLRIEYGGALIIMVSGVWATRSMKSMRMLALCGGSFLGCIFSPFFTLSPMSSLCLYFYDPEKECENPKWVYWLYPVILLAFYGVRYL